MIICVALSLSQLLDLYKRTEFIVYFSILISLAVGLIAASYIIEAICFNPERRKKSAFKNMSMDKIKRMCGIMFAVSGGVIASITVLLASTGVRLVSSSIQGPNEFTTFTPYVLIFILLVSAFTQVFCMNSGLRICDAIVVVPIFFTFYSVLALFNQNVWIIYLLKSNQLCRVATSVSQIGTE
jgi:magnesium transporter